MSVVDRLPFVLEPIAAGLPTTNPAIKQVMGGTNHESFVLRFPDSREAIAYWDMVLPGVYTYQTGVRITVFWRSIATANQTRLNLALAQVQAGDDTDPVYTNEWNIDVTPKPTSDTLSKTSLLTSFVPVAEASLHLRIKRDPTIHVPEMTGNLEILQVVVEPVISPIEAASSVEMLQYDSTPAVDGAKTVFIVPEYKVGKLMAFRNGIKVLQSNIVEVSSVTASILVGGSAYAPAVGETLEWVYIPVSAPTSAITFENYDSTGDIDGGTDEFTIPQYEPGTLQAYRNGIKVHESNMVEDTLTSAYILVGGSKYTPVVGETLEWLYIPYTP